MLPQPSDRVEPRLALVLLALVGVIAALWLVSFSLAQVLPPDPAPVSDELARQFFLRRALNPEPTERRIFLVNLLLLPVLTVAGAWLVRDIRRPDRYVLPAVVVLAVIGVGIVANGFTADVRRHSALVLVALGAAVVCTAISVRGPRLDLRSGIVAKTTFAVIALLAGFLAFSWRTLDVRSLQPAFRHSAHLDAVLYTTSQSVAGRLPLVDFPSQYGFFGTLLVPWFNVVGLSVWSFTLTMNALVFVALLAILVFIFREIENVPLAVGGCAAVLFVTVGWPALGVDPDPYFQYLPVRFVFPAVSVLIVRGWLRHPTRRGTALVSLFAGAALIWNLDSGVAVAGSWLGLLAFRTAMAALARGQFRPWIERTAVAAAFIALPAVLFAIWLRWRAGGPVDFSAAMLSQRYFYGAGFLMLPLPLVPHPWHVVVGLYVLGFVLGSFSAIGRIGNERFAVAHYLAFLGLGLFPYYQGRSHEVLFMSVVWPAVLIAFLIADHVCTLSKAGRLQREIAFAAATPTLAIGFLCALLLVRNLPGIARLSRQHLRGASELPGIAENIEFIRKTTHGQRGAVILARFQGVYFAETGLASSIRGPGLIEVLTRAQAGEIIREIELHPTTAVYLGIPYLESRPNPYSALVPILEQGYRLEARTASEELRLYVPRAR